MLPFAYFGIESSGLNLVIDLLIVFVVVTYLSLIYWTYTDARRRIADPMLVGCATAASLFPFVGTIVYMILRPPEYLDDVHERELEIEAAEARLRELNYGLCPHCDYRIERDFVRCPSCLRKLKERCVNCQRPLDRAWAICPYCESEVPDTTPLRRRRRRRAQAEDDRSEIGRPLIEREASLKNAAGARRRVARWTATARRCSAVRSSPAARRRPRATRRARRRARCPSRRPTRRRRRTRRVPPAGDARLVRARVPDSTRPFVTRTRPSPRQQPSS